MKKISKLESLPAPDQRTILNLCQHNTYDRVCEIVAQPRDEGGLALRTDPSSVCRFNNKHCWLGNDTQLLEQFSDILNGQTRNNGQDIANAMILLVQQRIFNALLSGIEIEQLKHPFRVLFTLKRHQLQERKLALQTKDPSEHSSLPDLGNLTAALNELKAEETSESTTVEPLINSPLQRGEPANTEDSKTVGNSFPCIRDPQEIAQETPDISHIADLAAVACEDKVHTGESPVRGIKLFTPEEEVSVAAARPRPQTMAFSHDPAATTGNRIQ